MLLGSTLPPGVDPALAVLISLHSRFGQHLEVLPRALAHHQNTDSVYAPSSLLSPEASAHHRDLQADLEHGRVRTTVLDNPNPRTTHSGICSSKCNRYQQGSFSEGPPEVWPPAARAPAFALAWHPMCSTAVAYVAIAAKPGDCHVAMKPALCVSSAQLIVMVRTQDFHHQKSKLLLLWGEIMLFVSASLFVDRCSQTLCFTDSAELHGLDWGSL